MARITRLLALAALSGLVPAWSVSGAHAASKPTGHEALKSVRHDWKKDASKTVRVRQSQTLPVPRNFGSLSAADRLAFLHARRDLDPTRFDRFHPGLGKFLAIDDRMRAAQSQNCAPLDGLLPNNAHFRYLQFRRNINPMRFDRYHPSLGALLAEDTRLRTGQGCVGGEIIPPPVTPPTPPGIPSPIPPIGGPGVGPTAVPEPGSLALLSLGLAGAVVPRMVRRWRRPKAD